MPHTAIALRMKRDLKRLLDQSATVYARTVGGGFTTQVKTGLACSLQAVMAQPPASSSERAVLSDLRTFYYDPDYTTMPDDAQIEVNVESGIRYNIVKGTVAPDVGPGNIVVMRHCDARRSR